MAFKKYIILSNQLLGHVVQLLKLDTYIVCVTLNDLDSPGITFVCSVPEWPYLFTEK